MNEHIDFTPPRQWMALSPTLQQSQFVDVNSEVADLISLNAAMYHLSLDSQDAIDQVFEERLWNT